MDVKPAFVSSAHSLFRSVDFAGVLWHVANLFAAPLGLGVMAASLARLLWWRSPLAPWRRLAAFACGGASVAHLAGLLVFGAEGRMASYSAMVIACALGMAWAARR